MPKFKNVSASNRRNEYKTAMIKTNHDTPTKTHYNESDLHLEIEQVSKSKPKKVLTWPAHILIFGCTQAGKTSLISDILDNTDKVYNLRKMPTERKLIIISPIPKIEIANKMSSATSWDMELYNNIEELNSEFIDHLIKRFQESPPNAVNILLLDDILTNIKQNQINFFNKLFSYFRHINVSIIGTIHSYDAKFTTILEQTGLIIAMYCLNTSSVIRNILARLLFKGTAKVWLEIRRIFLSNLRKHEYICINFTKESLSSEVFFVSDTIFHVTKGIKLSQIVSKM